MKNQTQTSTLNACYKPSFYNIVTAHPDEGKVILYNSLTGTRINVSDSVVDKPLSNWLQNSAEPEPEIKESLLSQLKKLGFIIDKDRQEQTYIKKWQDNVNYDDKARSVTVVLTRKCNLGCHYCFQDKEQDDAEVNQRKVLDYIRSQAIPGGSLTVTWFGGEPTLKMKMIHEFSAEIQRYCQENNVRYIGAITTNGVRLGSEKVKQLIQDKVMQYQISLDGPDFIQEQRRPALNGSTTYEQILENIRLLISHKANIIIKVIIDTKNWQHVEQMFADLDAKKILPHVRFAIQETESKFSSANYGCRFASLAEFARVKLYLLSKLASYGYPLSEPGKKATFCEATSPYATTIDMEGNLFRCSTEQENLVARLDDDNNQVWLNKEYQELFFTPELGTHEGCNSCKVLPICGGGCTIAAKNMANRQTCSFYKPGIGDYLRMLAGKPIDKPEITPVVIEQVALG
ncbi:radical SAM protein [Thalassomonas viridans]|uniref:Radical SAM protein n=1 Tax=Thalassomonas viridans TaxID=137584 RepID=A0AAE9Z6V4_9GAMM|nr:radical SAM protein [Thalassomonas viridans]WDE07866.1 radical SAM protein [Thalassomonas viridans]